MNLFTSLDKIGRYLAVALILCLITVAPAFSLNKRVNFEFSEQPMAEVANQISEQLDYTVLMDDEIAKVLVSGQFHDVTLDEFFSRRIFRGKNIVIMFDDNEQMVTIRSLGKKSSMTKYDQTGSTKLNTGLAKIDPMDQEVQPGIKRRDVKQYISTIEPMDQEVQPGVKRRDVAQYDSIIDPMDQEVQPGVARRDVPIPAPIDPKIAEIQPGIKRVDVVKVSSWKDTDPLDMEVQPGIKRRDVIQLNIQ